MALSFSAILPQFPEAVFPIQFQEIVLSIEKI